MIVAGGKRLYASVMGFVREPTAAGQIRRQVMFFVPLPILLLGVLALVLLGGWSAPGWMILLSGAVATGSLLLAFLVQPTPLPEGLTPEASVRRSLHRFRQITGLRIALAMTPVLVGAAASIAGGGLFPYAVALALAWPQLLLALPTYFTVSRARRAMEAWGTKAYLWAGLAQPARVEWPLVSHYLRARANARRTGATPAPPRTTASAAASGDDGKDAEPAVPASTEPDTRHDSVVPGLKSANTPVPRPGGQLLRLRANTRPKQRGTRSDSRHKTKN